MKKYLNAILISIFILCMITACNNNMGAEVEKETIVAKVNEKEITLSEYEKNIILFGGQYESVFGKDIWNQEVGDGITYKESFKKEMFDRMITQELVLQAAESSGIKISEEDINNELVAFKEKNESNVEFKNTLAENSIDDNFLKKQFIYELYLEKYKAQILESGVISEDTIKSYYDANAFRFTNDKVKASHILFKTVDENFKTLSDAEIENKLTIAGTVLNKISKGVRFEDMAVQYSEDVTTATNGGDLGYFKAGDMAQEFDVAAFSLNPGEVSEIVKTVHGYHIIKVYDKVQETSPLEEVKDGIIAKLQMDIFDEKVKELYAAAKIEENKEYIEKTGEKND